MNSRRPSGSARAPTAKRGSGGEQRSNCSSTDAHPLHVIGWYLPPDYKQPPQATQTEIMGGVQRYIQTLPSSYRLLLVGDTNIQTVRGLGGVMGKWCVRATLQELSKRKQAARYEMDTDQCNLTQKQTHSWDAGHVEQHRGTVGSTTHHGGDTNVENTQYGTKWAATADGRRDRSADGV